MTVHPYSNTIDKDSSEQIMLSTAMSQPQIQEKESKNDVFDEATARNDVGEVIALIPADGKVEWEWCPWLSCPCSWIDLLRTSSIIGLVIGLILFSLGIARSVKTPGIISRSRQLQSLSSSSCLFDPVEGLPGCCVFKASYLGDGFCHDYVGLNTTECHYDGGDCLQDVLDITSLSQIDANYDEDAPTNDVSDSLDVALFSDTDASSSKSGGALMGVGAALVVVSIAGLYASSVWKWNESKQGTYKLARAKQQQASDIWGKIDPLFRHIGKDVFFATSYAGLELQVLRDGTIEAHEAKNGCDDEENPLSVLQSMAKAAGGGGDDDE